MIAWEGPSRIDGRPVVLILTGIDGDSNNPKTGPMVQGWILRADVSPLEALGTGADVSVCGGCDLRPEWTGSKSAALGGFASYGGRICYTNPMGLQTIWHHFRAGKYPGLDVERLRAKLLRMGGYGDPAAVPEEAWAPLLDVVAGHTGYTHQWKTRRFRFLQRWCMASCDNPEQQRKAMAAGWSTFSVLKELGERAEWEDHCPASEEMGHLTTCIECLKCNGAADGQAHISILVHGSGRGFFRPTPTGQLSLPMAR